MADEDWEVGLEEAATAAAASGLNGWLATVTPDIFAKWFALFWLFFSCCRWFWYKWY